MLARSVQFRSVIAMVLVVVMPFCCCNISMLLGEGPTCRSESFVNDQPDGVHLSRAVDHRRASRTCCQSTSASERESSSSNSESNPTHDPTHKPHDCSCDKANGKLLVVEKPSIEVPAQIVVAVLDWCWRTELQPLAVVSERESLHQAVQRPMTSLVRMHCALIV
jgi:hypothetical protein